MTATSNEAEALTALLEMALVQLRVAVAGALPPGAAYRVELASTRRAAQRAAAFRIDRTHQLPPGWSEFVEVDDAIDALLARIATGEATSRAAQPYAAPPAVPALPADLRPDGTIAPAAAPRAPEPVAAPAAPHASAPVSAQTSPPTSPQTSPPTSPPTSPQTSPAAPASASAAPAATVAPPPQPSAPKSYVTYVDVPKPPAFGQPEPEPQSDGAAEYDEGYAYADFSASGYADEPDWAISGAEDDEAAGRYDPYATVKAQEGRVLSFDEAAAKPAPPPAAAEPDPYAVDLDETAYQQVGGSDDYDDYDDSLYEGVGSYADELAEATQVLERDLAHTSTAAAVQLHHDGSASIIGVDEPDEPSSALAIELGDAEDYGEQLEEGEDEVLEGVLGMGVVAYAPDEDDATPVSDVRLAARPPGAPTLTIDEIEGLFQAARDAAERDMVDGTLLYSDVLDAQPKHGRALLARGRLYLDLGDYTRAVSDFLRAESCTGLGADVPAALGDLFYARKDYRKAISYFDAAIEANPKHAWSYYRRGMSLYNRKSYPQAVEDLEKARGLDASLPSVDTYIQRAKKRIGT